ncbi:MAG: c-type cytochrome [Verrucomicrobia bacterium]|nr:c-type cytochrome [Verrucomicrobiota bacterium]
MNTFFSMKKHCRWIRNLCLVGALAWSDPEILQAAEPQATAPDSLNIKEGFNVELLYSVPKDQQGSWVAMCVDDKGRMIASDQYGSLFRITPPPIGQSEGSKVEVINLDIGHAQGLVYAWNSLYAVTNATEHQGRGLYRITDTNGDDQLDNVVLLKKFAEEGGEHGPHAVIVGPDEQSLYVVIGNQTTMVDHDISRPTPVWQEDLLLPRIYGNGFMRGVLAPRGWIAKTDPEGKSWEIIATGFRNEYDAAFNRHGELFTYDADMEWDVNTPWYRPTRVCMVPSGAEFGWRNGSGKWPAYYPDSLPPVVDIGPGSPTGVCFGYGAKFPAKYQEAFFINDWSYGKLYAVHLNPEGSAYSAEFEEFITGSPLPLTDIVVSPHDGAMYFAIGGRRTKSGLYRVTYTGNESTAPSSVMTGGEAERAVRRHLESFHGRQDPQAIITAWPFLGSKDRFLRFAARIAIEHQPVSSWSEKVFEETDVHARLTGLLALTRVGTPDLKGKILDALNAVSWNALTDEQKLEFLRVYSLTFIRMGEATAAEAQKTIAKLDPVFPADDRFINAELCQLLVYVQSPQTAAKGVALLELAPSQEEQIDYAKSLRLLRRGWNSNLQERYFKWFIKAASYRGGASFSKFVESIKTDALGMLTDAQKESMKDILEAEPEFTSPLEVLAARSFVKDWSVDELAKAAEEGLKGGRSFAKGRKVFGEAACFSCHRFSGEGGSMGPDLTSAAGKFSARDLLESIITPSKEISDQYAPSVFTLEDGDSVTGRIVNLGDDNITVNVNMFDPNGNVGIDRKKVVSIKPSTVSMMPEGLASMLEKEEILDLLAYVLSRGDKNHTMFK